MLCRGELQLRQSNYGCRTARISGRMISEVVVGHGANCRGLLLVAHEHGDQAQECEDGNVYEINIGGGEGSPCLECLDGRVIPSKVMVGHGAGCLGLLLEVVAHGDRAQEHGDCNQP
jgi:hypothetical protein